MRRSISVAFLLVLALFVLRHPADAADAVTAIGNALAALADGLAVFASAL